MISGLTRVTTISGGDSIPLGVSSQGDDRATSVTDLLAYMQANLTFSNGFTEYTTQYSTPLTGNSVIVSNTVPGSNIHMIVTPAGAINNLTLVFPILSSLVDKQDFLFNTSQAIAVALTLTAGVGTNIVGGPATVVQNGYFRLKFDILNANWYRVG